MVLPSPAPVWKRFMYYVHNNMSYVESIAEYIKSSLSSHKQSVLEQFDELWHFPMKAQSN